MKVKLDARDLNSSDLSWLCIQPMLLAVRGKDLQTKLEMYNQLTDAQKGLYLFYSFHNHAKTVEEFYWFADYNIHELRSWKGIKTGVLYFHDVELASLLDDIERFLEQRTQSNKPVSPSDLEMDKQLLADVKTLHDKYVLYSELTITRMNEWIRTRLSEFVENE